MLNRIIIINSELYAKASIKIGKSSSVQITAENNVGKSSFINALNFLYITDRDQMRFEDGRKLSDSMKHYFDGTSLHSFIIFEICKNGYYSILVKATPENTIEYYKITGEYDESCFVETKDGKFKARKWNDVIKELTLKNPTNAPVKLTNEELYNLVYNTDKHKNPVVWLKRSVKRNGRRSFSNSFTDIYRSLIRTSDINEKTFKNALLVADGQQHFPLNVLSSTSFEKIDEFEKKKTHLQQLIAIQPKFNQLKLVHDEFTSLESILGKLKYTFLKEFNTIENKLSAQTNEHSELSMAIRSLETKINISLKRERDTLIGQKTTAKNQLDVYKKNIHHITNELDTLQEYEPIANNLMYQGLKNTLADETQQKTELVSQLTQLERSEFTEREILNAIKNLENSILQKEHAIKKFDSLLYQNISDDETTIKKVYTLLNQDIAELDKSKILQKIQNSDTPLQFFDGLIDISDINTDIKLPTIKSYQEKLHAAQKELKEKKAQLAVIQDRNGVKQRIQQLESSIRSKTAFIQKVEQKPELKSKLATLTAEEKSIQQEIINIRDLIMNKDLEIEKERTALDLKNEERKQLRITLHTIKKQYESISKYGEIHEIKEVLDLPFESIYDKFDNNHRKYIRIKSNRNELKSEINKILRTDIQDVAQFIQEIDEEIINIPQTEKIIDSLLDTLSYEIGSPTHSFLTQFNDFKTFVARSYNQRLAEYPISNIQSVKVKIEDNTDLIEDLEKISKLKFSGGLDFDNSHTESMAALERQLSQNNGKSIKIVDLFKINVEITKVTGKTEIIDLSKQVQSRGTNIILKLYLFLNIIKELVHNTAENRVMIYVDELDAIGQKNVKHLIRFCKVNHFVPIFAAPRKVEGIEKYYLIKEPPKNTTSGRRKISFGELQSFPVQYRDAE